MARLAWLVFGVGAAWMLIWGLWGTEARTPWTSMVLMGAAAPLSWAALKQTQTRGRIVSAGALTILATTAWIAVCVLMAFPAFSAPAQVPAFTTVDADGNTVDEKALDHATLIVFFRGKW